MNRLYNLDVFDAMVKAAYSGVECDFSIEEVLYVFHTYFEWYDNFTGEPHPFLKLDQIRRIIEQMSFCEDFSGDGCIELGPEHYEALISAYFHTHFKNCDRNINHFFSGRIRTVKFYESCY